MAEIAPPLAREISAKGSGNSETEAELPGSPSSPSSPLFLRESSDVSSRSVAPPTKKQRLLPPTAGCDADASGIGAGISTMAAAAAVVAEAARTNSKSSHADCPVGRPAAKGAVGDVSGCEQRYSAEMLLDLAGSTSAEVRRMSEDERALVHYKRRLRNRESAKRSRARRQATITEIQGELCDLRELTNGLVERCVRLVREGERHEREAGRAREEIETLRKEKELLESMLRGGR